MPKKTIPFFSRFSNKCKSSSKTNIKQQQPVVIDNNLFELNTKAVQTDFKYPEPTTINMNYYITQKHYEFKCNEWLKNRFQRYSKCIHDCCIAYFFIKIIITVGCLLVYSIMVVYNKNETIQIRRNSTTNTTELIQIPSDKYGKNRDIIKYLLVTLLFSIIGTAIYTLLYIILKHKCKLNDNDSSAKVLPKTLQQQ